MFGKCLSGKTRFGPISLILSWKRFLLETELCRVWLYKSKLISSCREFSWPKMRKIDRDYDLRQALSSSICRAIFARESSQLLSDDPWCWIRRFNLGVQFFCVSILVLFYQGVINMYQCFFYVFVESKRFIEEMKSDSNDSQSYFSLSELKTYDVKHTAKLKVNTCFVLLSLYTHHRILARTSISFCIILCTNSDGKVKRIQDEYR